MKGEHVDLVTGILLGMVVATYFGAHLGIILPILAGVLGYVFVTKLLLK